MADKVENFHAKTDQHDAQLAGIFHVLAEHANYLSGLKFDSLAHQASARPDEATRPLDTQDHAQRLIIYLEEINNHPEAIRVYVSHGDELTRPSPFVSSQRQTW